MEFIKVIGKDSFLINADLLGVEEAWLWIGGREEGPTDNDDERVMKEREEEKLHPRVGEDGKVRPSGIEAVRVKRHQEYPDWYEINTTTWSSGKYRFNLYGDANEKTPMGSSINREIRDKEYSWLGIGDPESYSSDQKAFIYYEKNGQGFCIRIEILPDRSIMPAGTSV